MFKASVSCLLLLMSASALSAVEDNSYWDLRVQLGSYPGLKDSKQKFDDGSSGNYKWDSKGGGFDLYASHRLISNSAHGGYVQFGIFSRASKGELETNSNVEIEHSAIGILVGGGYSFVANSVYSLEFGPRLGLGASVVSETAPNFKYESDTGGYASLDLSVHNSFNVTERFQLTASIGVATWTSENTFTEQNTGAAGYLGSDATYSGTGGYITIGAGIRL